MKLLYIALCDLWENGEIGIRNKIFSQIRSLDKRYETYLVAWRNMVLCTFRKEVILDKKVLLCLSDIYNEIEAFVEREGIKVIYLRYLRTNLYLNHFLKHMKKKNVKVLIEFPTLPYDTELEGRVELEEDRQYRMSLKRYVKYSVNYNGLSAAYGIPSTAIQNGIDMDTLPLKKEHKSESITLIAVAAMNFWHGYDRLIKGMANYYKNGGARQKVYLRLVGEGKETAGYRDLIKMYGLEEYISLRGLKYGEELTEEFDQSDIAVAPLGGYRKNMYTDSSLKAKEYCARGIPMVSGSIDLAFPEHIDFIHRVENDETDIDVAGIVAFYHTWQQNGNSRDIRAYAEQYLTWDKIFERLFQSISI